MSLTVDLIRHAESDMNVNMANAAVPFIGGRQNEVNLTILGETQAVNLGHFAVSEGILPTLTYSSPAVRTRRTQELSCNVMGLYVKPIIDDRLQELEQGDWTNQPRSLYDEPDNKDAMSKLGSDFAPPGGESMNDVYRRTEDFFRSLTEEAKESDHIWAYTHGVLIKNWVGKLLGWTHEQTYKTPIDNVSLTRVVYEDDRWRVVFVNRSTS